MSVQHLKRELLSRWTYYDVLALVLARATSRQFRRDPYGWYDTVANLKRLARENSHPELLSGVSVVKRDPFPVYSPEIDGFLRAMTRSGVLSVEDMPQPVYVMTDATKESIVQGINGSLAKYEELIAELADEVDRHLGTGAD